MHVYKMKTTAARSVSTIMKKSSLQRNVVYIASNFPDIAEATFSLEKRGETLVNNLNVFKEVTSCINKASGDVGKMWKLNVIVILDKKRCGTNENTGNVLEGIIEVKRIDLKIEDIKCYKYAPVNTDEGERTFSYLKYVLSDRRHNLAPDNLKKMLVIMCNERKL